MTIPHDPAAEREVLGAMLTEREAGERAGNALVAEDFHDPLNAAVFSAVVGVRDEGGAPGATSVTAWLEAHPLVMPRPTRPQITALAGEGSSLALDAACDRVRFCALRRGVIARGLALVEGAQDSATDLADLEGLAQATVDDLATPGTTIAPGPGIDDWLAEPVPEYRWLVPGFIERAERVILTGWMEGGGKSVMQRQLAVQLASGLHWFASTREIPPGRVLFVDLENPEGIMRRNFRSLRLTAGDALEDQSRLVVRARRDGIDLLRARDRRWLAALVEVNRPDLLVIGPLYKMHESDPNDERAAKAVSVFLDRLRVRHDLALFIEAHPPHAQQGFKRQLRVYGASLWRRWPDFGIGLEAGDDEDDFRLTTWKPRDDRDWPTRLQRGGVWPWMRRVREEF